MTNSNIYNIIPTPFYEEKRKCYRIDYNKKTFRSDRYDSSGKPLSARAMKANVTEKVRMQDWSITGDASIKLNDAIPDWCTYLGYRVEPCKGHQNQKIEKHIKIVDEPRIGRSCFDQYYRGMRNHVLPKLGNKQIGLITREDVKSILDEMGATKRYNSSTVMHIRKAIRQFFEWQRIECKSIKENPVHDLTIKRVKYNRARRSGEPGELDKIFALMKYSHVLFACKLMLDTGMRPEEICGIPDNYDFSTGIYYMRQVVNKYGEVKDTGKSENAQRGIVLSKYAIKDIENQKEMKLIKGINSIFLFPNAYGGAMTPDVMSNAFRKFAKMAGSDLTLYELRHTALTIMSDELPERDVKGMFGHSESMNTAETYDHLLENRMNSIREKMNNAYNGYLNSDNNIKSKVIPLRIVK
jgi:integrase